MIIADAQCLCELRSALKAHLPHVDCDRLGVYLSVGAAGLCRAVFLNERNRPQFVGKFAIRASQDATVGAEFHTISALRGTLSPVADKAPQPLGLSTLSIGDVAFYSYKPGQAVEPWEATQDAHFANLVLSWLADLHSLTRADSIFSEEDFAQTVALPAVNALNRAGTDSSFWAALKDGLSTAGGVIGEAVPKVFTHGDFWANNVVRVEHSSEFYVVDWDLATVAGTPLLDLLHWFIYNAHLRYEIGMYDAATACIRSRGDYGKHFRSALITYCEKVGWYPQDCGAWLTMHFLVRNSIAPPRSAWQWCPATHFEWLFALPRVRQLGVEMDNWLRRHRDT